MTSTDISKLDLDRRRVKLVLEINAELFRESISIQQKHGGDAGGGIENARQDPLYIQYVFNFLIIRVYTNEMFANVCFWKAV